jgi:hypothetical protein
LAGPIGVHGVNRRERLGIRNGIARESEEVGRLIRA